MEQNKGFMLLRFVSGELVCDFREVPGWRSGDER
jgi:hypothetical protein